MVLSHAYHLAADYHIIIARRLRIERDFVVEKLVDERMEQCPFVSRDAIRQAVLDEIKQQLPPFMPPQVCPQKEFQDSLSI